MAQANRTREKKNFSLSPAVVTTVEQQDNQSQFVDECVTAHIESEARWELLKFWTMNFAPNEDAQGIQLLRDHGETLVMALTDTPVEPCVDELKKIYHNGYFVGSDKGRVSDYTPTLGVGVDSSVAKDFLSDIETVLSSITFSQDEYADNIREARYAVIENYVMDEPQAGLEPFVGDSDE